MGVPGSFLWCCPSARLYQLTAKGQMSSRDPQPPTYFPTRPVIRAASKPCVNQFIKRLRSDYHCTALQLWAHWKLSSSHFCQPMFSCEAQLSARSQTKDFSVGRMQFTPVVFFLAYHNGLLHNQRTHQVVVNQRPAGCLWICFSYGHKFNRLETTCPQSQIHSSFY